MELSVFCLSSEIYALIYLNLMNIICLISIFFVDFGGSINLAAVLDFVDSGHDLIIAADTSASDLIREIATECGVDFDEVRLAYQLIKVLSGLFLADSVFDTKIIPHHFFQA